MTQIAIYPGTFDPITYGHEDLISRATNIFERVIVAIADNAVKNPLFNLAQRISMVQHALQNHNNVEVIGFSNLLVNVAHQYKATIIIRGVRMTADFEYELQLANMNRALMPKLETVFLTPSERYSYVSSSLVKQIAMLGGDVSNFVNNNVMQAFNSVIV